MKLFKYIPNVSLVCKQPVDEEESQTNGLFRKYVALSEFENYEKKSDGFWRKI